MMTVIKTRERNNGKGELRNFSVDRGRLRVDITFPTMYCGVWLRGQGFASGVLIYNQCELEELLNISEFQCPHL